MKILVTGHRGYIGSKLYAMLESNNHIVHGIDLEEDKNVINDLPNETYDCVFHLAAFPSVQQSVENPSNTFKNNAYSTSVLLEWAKNHNVGRVVFSSSAAADNVSSPYGLHKLISEKECSLYSKLFGLDTVCLRYYNVYSEDQKYGGSYSTVVSAWMHMIRQGKPLQIDGDGEQTRDFIHVDDIVSANIFCMEYDGKFEGHVLNVASGQTFSLNYIKSIIDKHVSVSWISSPTRIGDVKYSQADISKILSLGWQPSIQFEQGLKICLEAAINEL